jgi:hypothetical protein
MTEAARAIETLVWIHQTIRHHIPEDHRPYLRSLPTSKDATCPKPCSPFHNDLLSAPRVNTLSKPQTIDWPLVLLLNLPDTLHIWRPSLARVMPLWQAAHLILNFSLRTTGLSSQQWPYSLTYQYPLWSYSLLIKLNSVAWVRERTIPTERPPLVGGVSVNFCG